MKRAPLLTPQQLRTLKAELLAERTRLERLMAMEEPSDESLPSYGSSSGSQEGLLSSSAIQTRTRARYESIVNALARLSTAEYGTCVGCHNPIAYGRLIVMPEAMHCVTCGPRV
jgi:RNA polymerase-binding transcription factor DksA